MQMRIASAAAALLVIVLFGTSLAGASPSYKRYTLSAWVGRVTVLLPSDWTVYKTPPPYAEDRQSGVVLSRWYISKDLEPSGTTLADVRASNTSPAGCRWFSGWGKAPGGYTKLLGSGYVTLPVGTVWHSTQGFYSHRGCKPGAREVVWQHYWLDRKLVTSKGQELFSIFEGFCTPGHCRAFNRQLAVIMHSIQLLPR